MSTNTQTTSIGGGPIMSTAQLRGEAETAEVVLDEFTRLLEIIGKWANELPERYVAAPFGTAALNAAVTHVTEADGQVTEISAALIEILTALDEADGLGETVTGIDATATSRPSPPADDRPRWWPGDDAGPPPSTSSNSPAEQGKEQP